MFLPKLAVAMMLALAGLSLPAVADNTKETHKARDGLTHDNVARWSDDYFQTLLDAKQVSGAAISVVAEGKLLFAKAYGYADPIAKTPVDLNNTQFRIGSITKTFTGTLLAKLIANGQIKSIDDPANRYLKRYQLPDNNGVPISIRHLMTHTAGFEDSFYFLGSEQAQQLPIAAEVFDKLRPAFVRPAGQSLVYSNFGVASLGLLLEDQLGQPIDKLMQEKIFQPLGMHNSQLLVDTKEPEQLGIPATISADGEFTRTRFVPINAAAAQTGAIVSTALDMARYMLAHLNHDPVLLPPQGYALMQQRHAENSPSLTGLGVTFFIDQWQQHKTLSHGGNWVGFHSWMTLLPERGLGVSILLMSEAPQPSLWQQLLPSAAARSPALLSASSSNNAFLKHFLGPKRLLGPAQSTELQQFTGVYQGDRRNLSSAEKMGELVYFGNGLLTIAATTDGLTLNNSGPWVPQANNVFVHEQSRNAIAFARNENSGKMQLTPDIGIYTYTRIAWWQNPRYHSMLLLACLVVTLLIGALMLKTAITGHKNFEHQTVLALSGCLLLLALPFAVFAAYPAGQSMMSDFYAGELARTKLVLLINNSLLAISLALAASLSLAHTRNRLALCALPTLLLAVAILGFHNGLGWSLPE